MMTLSYGLNCKMTDTDLKEMDLNEIYHYIKEGDHYLIKQTELLRNVRRYSFDRYRQMKVNLPFFSCSLFDPPIRKVQNLKCANGLILDLDLGTRITDEFRSKILQDQRICMAYISPSYEGMKLVFQFDETVSDPVLYSNIYKAFSNEFASAYQLFETVDFVNSDASRISFICYDPEAYMNADAIPISVPEYEININENNDDEEDQISPDVYRSILNTLGTKAKVRKTAVQVSPMLHELIPDIASGLNSYGISLLDHKGIQYGIKVFVEKNKVKGEFNIYHGKRGFSVTTSPKHGTNIQLNELARHIVESLIFGK